MPMHLKPKAEQDEGVWVSARVCLKFGNKAENVEAERQENTRT